MFCGTFFLVNVLVLLTVPLKPVCSHGDEKTTSFTIQYTADNFNEALSKKNHFIMFYAPWCGHCQRLTPIWEQLAEMLNEDESNNIRIGKVDCTTDSDVCNEYDVTGYPTLKFFKVGNDKEGVKFRGTRDLPTLTNFINEQLREGDDEESANILDLNFPEAHNGLLELTEDTFDRHVASGRHFVKFYAPWCGHCQKLAPIWEQLAKSLEFTAGITVGKVDCTQYKSICSKFDIRGYPTLLWIENGKKVDKYQGERSADELKQYVSKMLGENNNNEDKMETKEDEEDALAANSLGELTGATFSQNIKRGVALVKFFAPWCGHCKRLAPTWNDLANKLQDTPDVLIGKVDCTLEVNRQLCNDEQVEGFPTIFLYTNGRKITEYRGNRNLDDLYDFVIKHKTETHDEL